MYCWCGSIDWLIDWLTEMENITRPFVFTIYYIHYYIALQEVNGPLLIMNICCSSVGGSQVVMWFCFVFFCRSSLWPAFTGGGGHLWALSQFLGQCSPVHLQRLGGAPHPDQVEAPGIGQQRRVLRQPLPRLLLPQPGHPGSGPLL